MALPCLGAFYQPLPFSAVGTPRQEGEGAGQGLEGRTV